MFDVTADTHRHDGYPGGNGHLECAFLEGEQLLTQVARAFREYPDRSVFVLQRVGGGQHRLARLLRIAAVDQHIAGQPEQLPEQWHPFQALFADAHGTAGYHVAKHKQVIVGLMIGDDHAAVRFIHQRPDFGLHPQTQNAHGRPRIQACAQAAVVRVERPAQAEDYTQHTRHDKMQTHQ
ncbi:hypothetical protein D3C81_1600140 [compost metagenome]